uniref:NADH-ubiquinone oxidoreductase chain 2 n=1 Tax=Neophonus bruchi TaxID=1143075 RepID=A0A0S2M7X1_9COLE|nr:NADH deshydrogenase subunit 2 [Neophonus bruchi]
MLFLTTALWGTLIAISSYTWMGMWMGLEINLLSIIPLMNNIKNSMSSESSIKYFITQAIASTMILLMAIIMSYKNFLIMNWFNMNYSSLIFNSALMMKMGAAPFHFWFPEVMEGLSWMNSFMLLTWQKIAPLILINYNLSSHMFLIIIILFSMIISSILGVNQTSLRKILAYSSINHLGWMISSIMVMETVWIIYFIIYSLISFNIIILFKMLNTFNLMQFYLLIKNNKMIKLFFMMNFMSMGGLPPFLGFFPKWLTIQALMNNNLELLAITMLMMTLFTLFYYMRMTFSTMTLMSNETNFMNHKLMNKNLIFKLNFLMILMLFITTLVFNLI